MSKINYTAEQTELASMIEKARAVVRNSKVAGATLGTDVDEAKLQNAINMYAPDIQHDPRFQMLLAIFQDDRITTEDGEIASMLESFKSDDVYRVLTEEKITFAHVSETSNKSIKQNEDADSMFFEVRGSSFYITRESGWKPFSLSPFATYGTYKYVVTDPNGNKSEPVDLHGVEAFISEYFQVAWHDVKYDINTRWLQEMDDVRAFFRQSTAAKGWE